MDRRGASRPSPPGAESRITEVPPAPSWSNSENERMPTTDPPAMKPDPEVVLDLLEAFRRSKTMFAAVSLGIFDTLAERPRSAVELAADLKLVPGALERLLDAC